MQAGALFHKVRVEIRSKELGATLIETALVLPLLLFFIFFVIWIGAAYHEKAVMQTSIGVGLRLAASRSDQFLMNSRDGIIPQVEDWRTSGGDPAATSPVLDQLLRHGVQDWAAASAWYDNDAIAVFSSIAAFRNLPAPYIYAMIYINQAALESIGNSVRFACDPNDSNGDPFGCLGCRFLNPTDMSDTAIADNPPPTNVIAIECKYRPAGFLLGPVGKLLRLFSGGGGGNIDLVYTERRKINFRSGTLG